MILSFSVSAMLPYLYAGLLQAAGEAVGAARVKRQTIRQLGARGKQLLEHDPITRTIPYEIDLWWKSRTAVRFCIGRVPACQVYAINILHSTVTNPDGTSYPVCRIDGPRGWRRGDTTLFWSPGDEPNGFCSEAYVDGFDSPEAFRDYFVPNLGDRFDAILYKW